MRSAPGLRFAREQAFVGNRDHSSMDGRQLNESIISAFELFVTAYHRCSIYYPMDLFLMRWRRGDEGDQRGHSAGWDGGVRDRGLCFDRNGDSRRGMTLRSCGTATQTPLADSF